jgi:hypothetical protein
LCVGVCGRLGCSRKEDQGLLERKWWNRSCRLNKVEKGLEMMCCI